MSDRALTLACPLHGPGRTAYVCRHLSAGLGCGYNPADAPGDPWPDAWCDACAHASDPAALEPLCHRCYERARDLNLAVPSPVRPGELALDETRFVALLMSALAYTQRCQDRAEHEFHILGYERWFWTGVSGELRFHDEPPTHELVADADVIGSFSLDSHTWLWAWDNDTYSEATRKRMEPLRVFGEVRGLSKLSDPAWVTTEEECWELAAISNYLLGGQGVYRAPMDHLYLFLLLDKLRFRAVSS